MLIRLWLALVGLALAQPAFAQQPDRLAAALALPMASELVGARDAPRFAWIVTEAGVRNIWTGTRGEPARRLTAFASDDGQLLYDLVFSNDGTRLAFVRGGDDEYPNEGELPNTGAAPLAPAQQLFVVAIDSGGAPQLVGEGHSPAFSPDGTRVAFTRQGGIWTWAQGREPRRIARVSGGIEGLTWSQDGISLLFSEDRGQHSHVGLIEAEGGRLTYLDPGLGHSIEPVFSPDGRQVAFIRYLTPPVDASADSGPYWSIRVADLATGTARTLWQAQAGPGGRYAGTRSRNLFWSRDGRIVFPWERTGWLHVYAIDATAFEEPAALTSGAFEVEAFVVDPGSGDLLYAANAGDIDRRRIWRRQRGSDQTARLGNGDGMHFAPVVARDEIAALATGVANPAHPVLLTNRTVPLAAVPAATGFVAPEPVTFRAADGVEVHAQLFLARAPGRHPALIFIHGGPRRQMLLGFHTSAYYARAYVMNQHLAALGYDVLSVNYRSGTGYGLAFRDAPEIARAGASEYRDILAAGRWLAARDHVDPARIGLWGGSWGGYLTALGLARDSDLFAAGVDLHGVHTLLRPLPSSLSPDDQARARQLQWLSSPIASIDRWRSPVLLIHGDHDRNVDFSQSLLLAGELAARRIPYRDLVFPNERHSFFRHENWLRALRASEQFLDQVLMRREPLR